MQEGCMHTLSTTKCNLIKPSVAPRNSHCGPQACHSLVCFIIFMSCLYIKLEMATSDDKRRHKFVFVKHGSTGHQTSLSYSTHFISSLCLSAYMKVLWFDSAMTTRGNRCPWNESQVRFLEAWKETQWSPCASDGRLPPCGMRTAGELRQPPVRSPQGIRYRQLDIWTFCSLLLWGGGKKMDLFGDHKGFDACCVITRCSALPLLCPCAYYRFH